MTAADGSEPQPPHASASPEATPDVEASATNSPENQPEIIAASPDASARDLREDAPVETTPEEMPIEELLACAPVPVEKRTMGCLPIVLTLLGLIVLAPLAFVALAFAYRALEIVACVGAALLILGALFEFLRRVWLRKWWRAAHIQRIEQRRLLREVMARRAK